MPIEPASELGISDRSPTPSTDWRRLFDAHAAYVSMTTVVDVEVVVVVVVRVLVKVVVSVLVVLWVSVVEASTRRTVLIVEMVEVTVKEFVIGTTVTVAVYLAVRVIVKIGTRSKTSKQSTLLGYVFVFAPGDSRSKAQVVVVAVRLASGCSRNLSASRLLGVSPRLEMYWKIGTNPELVGFR